MKSLDKFQSIKYSDSKHFLHFNWALVVSLLLLVLFNLTTISCSDNSTGTDPAVDPQPQPQPQPDPPPAAEVAVVEISPRHGWLLTGDTVQMEVVLRDANGWALTGREIIFESSDNDLAEISESGLLEVKDIGDVTITVSSEGKENTATFSLKPGGGLRVPELAVVDSLITDMIERYDLPGAAVGITRNERLVLLRGYGYADRDAGEIMTADHRFRIASLSKPVAAVAILELADRGLLDLDQPVFELLNHLQPLPGAIPDSRLDDILVKHLIQHTGGWDRDVSGDWTWTPHVRTIATDLNIPGPPNQEEIIRWSMGRQLNYDPGSKYAYSNLGYVLLARIVENVTGQTFEDFVRNEILIPAGAERMVIGNTFFEDRLEGEVRYHDTPTMLSVYPGRGQVEAAYGGFSLPMRDGQGGWVSSPADYLRFLHAVDGRPNRHDVVGSSVPEWITTRPTGPAFDGTTTWYTGFSVRSQSGDYFWSHSGGLPGTRTIVIHRPDGVSYVIFLNASGSGNIASEVSQILGAPLNSIPASEWPNHDLFNHHP
ncbi:MAG: hypothetical protein EA359_18795 [Balneolaceae bacterium]|nr:MAG: hypothetical protein EA359_18795 [Balneolaceae bacterium]